MKRKKIQDEERYFIRDEVLKSIEEDEFGHKNFALVLKNIIDKQKAPLNIGIFGKWGVGKSSIVSLYKRLIKDKLVKNAGDTKNPQKFAFIDFPVWKYTQKGSLRNKFMFKIAEGLFVDIDKLKERIYGTRTVITSLLLKPEYLFDELRRIRKNFPWILFLTGLGVATILTVILSKLLPLKSISDVSSIIWIYCLFVIPSIIKFIVQVFRSAKVRISYSKFDSDEQFENEFIGMVENRKCKKTIFVDDLDRCPIDKVVETVETIKTFLDIPSCVFIIACDNEVIAQAINESNEIYKKSDENNGVQYLEKFFQYTITVPPFIRRDMREYAENILKKDKSKLLELPDIDDILFVLIHGNVVNPRKAIVLINSFVSDYLVVKEREQDPNSKLNLGMITRHLPALAKTTVLKHDYPEFYSDLEKNKDLIKWMTVCINGEEELLEPYQKEKCKPYILRKVISRENGKRLNNTQKRWDESYYIEPKERGLFYLYNFLSATREYDVDITDMRPFLFLGQDSASYGMADEYLESINSTLRAGQVPPMKSLLETEKREQKTDISNIMLDWIENDLAGPELRKSLQVLSECLPIMSEDVIPHAASILTDKTLRPGIKERIKSLDIKGMFFALTKVKRQASKVVNIYIDSLSHQDLIFSKKILDNLFEHESLVKSSKRIEKVRSFLEKREESGEEKKE
ncbi:MAG TPA: hypothetical protein ENI23_18085 [bacterium]|nr:hypothetical protein [bacterium]